MFDLKDIFAMTFMGVAASFIGFCVYFDNKSHRNSHYSQKKAEARQFLQREKSHSADIEDNLAMENEFLHQIQLGEAKILCGDIEEGVEHLAKAIFLCDKKVHLLQTLQAVLADNVFAKLMMMVEEKRIENPKLFEEFNLVDKQIQTMGVSPLGVLETLAHNIEGAETEYFGV